MSIRIGSYVITTAVRGNPLFAILYFISIVIIVLLILLLYKRIKNKLRGEKGE
jgi:hypothetical protein